MINLLEEIKYSQYLFPSTIEEIDQMTGEEFENFLFWYYKKAGYKVTKTTKTNDLGIDLIVTFYNTDNEREENIGIQAKRWSTPVPKEQLTKMMEAKDYYKLDYMFLITTNRVTSEANLYANNHDIIIKSRETIYQILDELKNLDNIKFKNPKYNNQIKNIDQEIVKKLKELRNLIASEENVPCYMILTNETINILASKKPKTLNDLSSVHGIGEKKLNKYGNDILNVINKKIFWYKIDTRVKYCKYLHRFSLKKQHKK